MSQYHSRFDMRPHYHELWFNQSENIDCFFHIYFISTLHDKSTANNVRKNIRNKLKIEQKHLSNRYSKVNRMQFHFFRK